MPLARKMIEITSNAYKAIADLKPTDSSSPLISSKMQTGAHTLVHLKTGILLQSVADFLKTLKSNLNIN